MISFAVALVAGAILGTLIANTIRAYYEMKAYEKRLRDWQNGK